jgi:hypothetical protein
MPPLRRDLGCKVLIPGQTISFGQYHQVLVPVEFPGDFGISDFLKIEKLDLKPRLAGATFAVHQVQVPVNVSSVIEILVPE